MSYWSTKPQAGVPLLHDEQKPKKLTSYQVHTYRLPNEAQDDSALCDAEDAARDYAERSRLGMRQSSFDEATATDVERQAHESALAYARRINRGLRK